MLKLLRIKLIVRPVSFILICSVLLSTNGCYYFKVKKEPAGSQEILGKMQEENRFIILHLNDKTWQLNNISLSEKSLEGDISDLIGHDRYKTVRPYRSNRYKKSESEVVNEVHVYVSGFHETGMGRITVPEDAISKIEIYDRDSGATFASWMFGTVGVMVGAMAVIMIIVLLTKSSCPFVYCCDGNDFVFTGEIFSGAIQPGLERDDYLKLPAIKPSEKEFRIILTNEVHEIQYINNASLVIVRHDTAISVLFDKNGILQTFSSLQSPVSAINKSGNNILKVIAAKDSLNYSGDAVEGGKDGVEQVFLKFINQKQNNQAKLVVRAKNSFWLDVLFTRFHKYLGGSYERFSKRQESAPSEKLKRILIEQNIPLSVYVQKEGKWQFADYFNIAGPMAMRDDVLPLNLEGIDSDTINIKLETGFLFWEIDYAALDFSANDEAIITETPVKSAILNSESDVRDLLQNKDLRYLTLKEVGDNALISFEEKGPQTSSRSVFLHTSGFYKILREQEGPPDLKALRTFKKPGRFPQYSREVYELLSGR